MRPFAMCVSSYASTLAAFLSTMSNFKSITHAPPLYVAQMGDNTRLGIKKVHGDGMLHLYMQPRGASIPAAVGVGTLVAL